MPAVWIMILAGGAAIFVRQGKHERVVFAIHLGTAVHAVLLRNIQGPHAAIDEEQRQGDGQDNGAEHCERYWGRGLEK